MVDPETKDTSPKSTPALIRRDILAAHRTAMAVEGSFKAWIRTGLSMIGFGFTIYNFLMSLPLESLGKEDPVFVGLFMIGIGTISILFGAVEYLETTRELHQDYGVQIRKAPLLFGLLIAGFGIVLFIRIAILSM
jgi:putative membrane protein